MAKLKGVIFGIRDVLVQHAQKFEFDEGLMAEIGQLVKFLNARGIQAVAIGNKDWLTIDNATGAKQSLKSALKEGWGVDFEWFIYGKDGFPAKQTAAALQHIRDKMDWKPNETLYLGNSVADMRSAVNGETLFLNALWFDDNNEYGFRVKSPKEVARFIDTFCLREHWWYFCIEDGERRVYALAPYSTYKVAAYKAHSEDFIKTVKHKLGDADHVDFWAKYLCTSMYFSGLYEGVDYITPYPGHKKGTVPSVLAEPMTAFAKCFRTKFVQDAIVRHTDSVESKTNRDTVDHVNQINTIVLNPKPEKKPGECFKNPPITDGKTVLVVDDILTSGYSFEAARLFIRQTKAKVICVGFLKSLNRDYEGIAHIDLGFPNGGYEPQSLVQIPVYKSYTYSTHVVDKDAASELSRKLDGYHDWDWPN